MQLLEHSDNQSCVDCEAPLPRWASIITLSSPQQPQINIGCFCCQDCAGHHRRLGVHIVFVRSVDHDTWKDTEILAMTRGGGNTKVNAMFEALLQGASRNVKSLMRMDSAMRDRFISDKYQRRLWYVNDASVATRPSSTRTPRAKQRQSSQIPDRETNKNVNNFDLSTPITPVEHQRTGLEEINFFSTPNALEIGLLQPAATSSWDDDLYIDDQEEETESDDGSVREVAIYGSDSDNENENDCHSKGMSHRDSGSIQSSSSFSLLQDRTNNAKATSDSNRKSSNVKHGDI
jgi:hypothetical protein